MGRPKKTEAAAEQAVETTGFGFGKIINVKLTLDEKMLGTAPNNKEIYEDYIASKAPDAMSVEDEIDSVGVTETIEKGMTVFHRDENGTPFMFDYQVKGFFKGAAKFMRAVPNSKCSKFTAYKTKIDGMFFVYPRNIYFGGIKESDITTVQRPLRAQTPQGERVALAISEAIPAGTTLKFSVLLLDPAHLGYLMEMLEFGQLSGLGCWRNSGAGRFHYEILDDNGNVIGGNMGKEIL